MQKHWWDAYRKLILKFCLIYIIPNLWWRLMLKQVVAYGKNAVCLQLENSKYNCKTSFSSSNMGSKGYHHLKTANIKITLMLTGHLDCMIVSLCRITCSLCCVQINFVAWNLCKHSVTDLLVVKMGDPCDKDEFGFFSSSGVTHVLKLERFFAIPLKELISIWSLSR